MATITVLQCFEGSKALLRVANILVGTSLELRGVKVWQGKSGDKFITFPKIERTEWEVQHNRTAMNAVKLHTEETGDQKAPLTAGARELEANILNAIMTATITPRAPKGQKQEQQGGEEVN